jgi:hypothetical protein
MKRKQVMKKTDSLRTIVIGIAPFLFLTYASFGEIASQGEKSSAYAPEFGFDEHLIEYFHPKNDAFKERYFLKNSLALEAAFYSWNNRSFILGQVIVNFDMGRQSGAILLDPREVDMGFGPLFEYRRQSVLVQAGLDHHCFHQIDRGEWNTLYWNKLFMHIGSLNMRKNTYRQQLRRCDSLNWKRQLSWEGGYGFYLHEFFGLFDTNAVSWGNAYIHELSLSGCWTFFHSTAFAAFANVRNLVRIDRGGKWLWTEEIGCETMALKGDFGVSLFFNWIVCDQSIERENRDRLVEIGARVFR